MTGSDLIYCCDELFQEAFLQPIQSLRVAALGALVALVPVSLCVKFLCQRKSSLTRLQQTRYDRVQGRANRAPIEQLQQDPICSHRALTSSQEGRKEGALPITCLSRQEGQCPRRKIPNLPCRVSGSLMNIAADGNASQPLARGLERPRRTHRRDVHTWVPASCEDCGYEDLVIQGWVMATLRFSLVLAQPHPDWRWNVSSNK